MIIPHLIRLFLQLFLPLLVWVLRAQFFYRQNGTCWASLMLCLRIASALCCFEARSSSIPSPPSWMTFIFLAPRFSCAPFRPHFPLFPSGASLSTAFRACPGHWLRWLMPLFSPLPPLFRCESRRCRWGRPLQLRLWRLGTPSWSDSRWTNPRAAHDHCPGFLRQLPCRCWGGGGGPSWGRKRRGGRWGSGRWCWWGRWAWSWGRSSTV